MFRQRGVVQIPGVGEHPLHVAKTAEGVVAFEFRVNASVVSPEMERQMIARLHRWLDRIDPPLRVVQGGAAPPPERQ